MALPRLEDGANTFKLSTGSHSVILLDRMAARQGELPGETLENLRPGEDPAELRVVDPSRPGTITFGLGTAGIVDEVRVALKVIRAGEGARPEVVLSVSENDGVTWRELERFVPHQEHELGGMWFNHILKDRSLNGTKSRLKVQVSGAGLSRITANSLVRENPGQAGRLASYSRVP